MKYIISLFIFISATSFAQIDSSNTGSTSNKIYIDISGAQVHQSSVAFPFLRFIGNPSAAVNYQTIGAEIYRTVQNDLEASNYFKFMDSKAFLEDTAKTNIVPKTQAPDGFTFETWQSLKADFLIRGQFSVSGPNLTFEVYVYHVSDSTVVLGKKYTAQVTQARKLAHTFSNNLLEALTGKNGMFLSKLVYSSDRGGGDIKEVYIMDWDGFNVEKITNHKSVAMSPAWSPDATKIAYTAIVQRTRTKTRNWDLYLFDLKTDTREIISYRQGINSGANFSPDGKYIYVTLSQNNSPDVYKLNLAGDIITRITNGPHGAMNVEPVINSDQTKIAFSSDRSGNPMIFEMNADGSGVTRLTFGGKFNASPSWSPDGKKLAFAGWADKTFDIYVMDMDSKQVKKITSAKKPNGGDAKNEDPSFSPDGRFIVYSSNRTGKSQLYMSNLDGTYERRLTNDNHNYFKPKWSVNINN